jgi:hypothetical protein
VVLTNHRVLEKLDVLDVQTLVLEILARVDSHLDKKASLDVYSCGCIADFSNVIRVMSGFLGVKSVPGGSVKLHSTQKSFAPDYTMFTHGLIQSHLQHQSRKRCCRSSSSSSDDILNFLTSRSTGYYQLHGSKSPPYIANKFYVA